MNQPDPLKVRASMTESVRQLLNDAHLTGRLPEDVARAFVKDADTLVNSVVSILLPGLLARRGAKDADAGAKTPVVLSAEAIKTIAILPTLRPNIVLTEDRKTLDGALLFCTRGNKMLKAERWQDAKAFFHRALSIQSDLKAAWVGLAEAHEKLGETAEAEKARERVASLP